MKKVIIIIFFSIFILQPVFAQIDMIPGIHKLNDGWCCFCCIPIPLAVSLPAIRKVILKLFGKNTD